MLFVRVWFARLFQKAGVAAKIDLFDRDSVAPFVRHGMGDVLFIVGGLAIFLEI